MQRGRNALAAVPRLAKTHVPSSVARELLPFALLLAVMPWLVLSVRHYVDAAMYRDTNMFSYATWCFRHGQRMYVDYAMPDGPLILLIQGLFQSVGGTSDHDLRVADRDFQIVCGALIGALIVPAARDRLHTVVRRVTWACVGATVWLVQTVALDWSYSMQREGYYVTLGVVALTLAYASAEKSPRVAVAMLGFAGAIAGVEPFGKHTGVLYVALVLFAAWLVRGKVPRRKRILAVAIGVLAATLGMLALVAVTGSLRGFWFWYWRYDITVYRFQFLISFDEILTQSDRRVFFSTAGLAFLAGIAALRVRTVPAAFAAFAVAPMIQLGAAVAQHRGWTYYYLPAYVSANACMLGLMALAWCTRRYERRSAVHDLAGAVVFAFFAARFHNDAANAAFLDKGQMHTPATPPDPDEPLAAATFIAEHTRSDDRVFYYGADPIVSYAARRLPGSPYIVAWMLDFRNSLREQPPYTVTPKERERIVDLQNEVQADACNRLTRDKPPVIAIHDMSAILTKDALGDVLAFCPALSQVLASDYHEPVIKGRHRIYLRNDRD